VDFSQKEIARFIDHTNLKAGVTSEQIIHLCREAAEHNFFAVCVPPAFVRLAAAQLAGSHVSICTVVGFPLGFNTTEAKRFEAEAALKDGAQEIDMVINVGALRESRFDYVEKEIKTVAKSLVGNAILKVIIETALLTREQKVNAAKIISDTPAHFVKTSTGYSSTGATVEDILLLKSVLGETKKIKAAGGIRTRQFAQELIWAGASRLGCSNSLEILK